MNEENSNHLTARLYVVGEIIPVLTTNEEFIPGILLGSDQGGMSFEEFDRARQARVFRQVKNIHQLPADLHSCFPLSDRDCWDLALEFDCFSLCEAMDINGDILFSP